MPFGRVHETERVDGAFRFVANLAQYGRECFRVGVRIPHDHFGIPSQLGGQTNGQAVWIDGQDLSVFEELLSENIGPNYFKDDFRFGGGRGHRALLLLSALVVRKHSAINVSWEGSRA